MVSSARRCRMFTSPEICTFVVGPKFETNFHRISPEKISRRGLLSCDRNWTEAFVRAHESLRAGVGAPTRNNRVL